MSDLQVQKYESNEVHKVVQTTVIYTITRSDPPEVFNHYVEFEDCAPLLPAVGTSIEVRGSALSAFSEYQGEVTSVRYLYEEDSAGFHQTIHIQIT